MARKTTTQKVKRNDEVLDIIDGFNKNLLSNVRIDVKHKNETQKKLTQSIKKNDITICTGPPGTGKTFISCAQALLELKQDAKLKQIILVKSVTTLKTEEIGFLKGTMEEKMEPFMFSFVKNFEKIIGYETTESLKAQKIIEILPIAYMRGVNIDNAVIIIDEAQNITIDNIKTILTRMGENSKIILLGDLKQIDQKNKKDSALRFLIDNFKNIDRIGIVEFSLDEVVRHPLIKIIEPIFDLEEKRNLIETQRPVKKERHRMTWLKKFFINLSKKIS